MTICWILAEPHGSKDPRSRVHTTLVVVLVIVITSTMLVAAFFFYKKSPRLFTPFENPLYFDSQQSKPDVVDTNKLIENAEVENPVPIITLWSTKKLNLLGCTLYCIPDWCILLRCFISVFALYVLLHFMFSYLTICHQVWVSMEVDMANLMEQNNSGSMMSQWEWLVFECFCNL